MLQNAPNFLRGACPRTPLANAMPHAASRFAACHSPSPPKSWRLLANPAYAHGLLLRNLFEEMRT